MKKKRNRPGMLCPYTLGYECSEGKIIEIKEAKERKERRELSQRSETKEEKQCF